jgi:GNAT superfamily N-acetyltransferase
MTARRWPQDMFEIRLAKTEDRESIHRIYLAAVGAHADATETHWDRLIGAGGVLVAQIEKQIIGFGGIEVTAIEQVKWLYLMPQYQRAGVGSEILKGLERIGWETGQRRLRLHAAPAAVNFYRKNGYTDVPATEQIGHDHEGVEMMKARPAQL